jgi:hypothetical protein
VRRALPVIAFVAAAGVLSLSPAPSPAAARAGVAWYCRLADHAVQEGKDVVISNTLFARREDGSTVEAKLSGNRVRAALDARRLVSPSGQLRLAFDRVRAVSTFDNAAEPEAATVCPPKGTRAALETRLSGTRVLMLQWRTPNGTRMTTWLAPELGCHSIQEALEVPDTGGHLRLTRYSVPEDLKMSAPPGPWFDVPAGYVEMSPSQAMARAGVRFNGDSSPLRRIDEAYFANAARQRESGGAPKP